MKKIGRFISFSFMMLLYFTPMFAGEELAQQLISQSIEQAIADRLVYDPIYYTSKSACYNNDMQTLQKAQAIEKKLSKFVLHTERSNSVHAINDIIAYKFTKNYINYLGTQSYQADVRLQKLVYHVQQDANRIVQNALNAQRKSERSAFVRCHK